MLRPELEEIEGFVDNVRYRSLIRDGWILSLSGWRDEEVPRAVAHQDATSRGAAEGRDLILADYHLRVGQVTADNQIPEGCAIVEQRLDETEVGEGTAITLINATRPPAWKETNNPYDCAESLGLNPWAAESTSWDIFDAVLTPGDLILLISWENAAAAEDYVQYSNSMEGARVRQVRIVRDYGMFDRREAPQYYPDAAGAETIHT